MSFKFWVLGNPGVLRGVSVRHRGDTLRWIPDRVGNDKEGRDSVVPN